MLFLILLVKRYFISKNHFSLTSDMLKFSLLFVVFIYNVHESAMNSREKRFLIFPRGNPTRHQFVAGIGVPVDVGLESMTLGYVFKAQYFLPYNVSQLKPTKLRLERDVAELHMKVGEYGQVLVGPKVESGGRVDDDEDSSAGTDDEVRWVIYKGLEYILNGNRIDGKQCVLRAICEASRLQFTHESGLLGEILHILLVPSTTHSGDSNDYIFAEHVGRRGDDEDEDCESVFERCTFSLLNILSQIH